MALPGQRGYGRALNRQRGNASQGITESITGNRGPPLDSTSTLIASKPRSPLTLPTPSAIGDPSANRRIDALEQRLNGHDQVNRSLLEQIMKITQEFKLDMKRMETTINEERNMRMKIESTMTMTSGNLSQLQDQVKRVEDSAKENKNALNQLIAHTKNVERAVTMNQQDLLNRKEQQSQKLNEIGSRLSVNDTHRETLSKTLTNVKDELTDLSAKVDNISLEVKDAQSESTVQRKMLESQIAQWHGLSESDRQKGKLSESQMAALDGRILQLQQLVVDVQSKLNHEKKEREVDETELNKRITEVASEVADQRRRREADLRDVVNQTRELASTSEGEKQKMIMQMSAVTTDLKRTLEERDGKLRQSLVHRMDEVEQQLKLESQQRVDNEKESRLAVEESTNKMKNFSDENAETVRKLLSAEQDVLKNRIQELTEFKLNLEVQVSELRSEVSEFGLKTESEIQGANKVMEAKIVDLDDKLRLGMAKMQSAIGETDAKVGQFEEIPAQSGTGSTAADEVDFLGIREDVARQMTRMEDRFTELKTDVNRQEETIANRLKMQQHAGEEASTILGDKLQQKMDAITFTQERMRRQLEDLSHKTSGAPSDISDMRDRFEDMERNLSRKVQHGNNSDKLESIEKDVDHLMGRGETSDVSGVPTMPRLLKEIDNCKEKTQKVEDQLNKVNDDLSKKIEAEQKEREESYDKLHKDQVRAEKRTKVLKERIKKLKPTSSSNGPDEDEFFEDEEEGNE